MTHRSVAAALRQRLTFRMVRLAAVLAVLAGAAACDAPSRAKGRVPAGRIIAIDDRALAACGCTTLEYDSQPIMPGSTAAVELRFDARGAWGWQLKLVRLRLLGGGEPFRLYVEADVD